MKNVSKIAEVVFTAVLYSIAVLLFTVHAKPQFSFASEKQPAGNQIFFEVSPSGILGIPLTQEPGVNLYSGASHTGSDFHHKNFSACLEYTEKAFSSKFVQYAFQAQNFPVRLRKADLLFPFHNFW